VRGKNCKISTVISDEKIAVPPRQVKLALSRSLYVTLWCQMASHAPRISWLAFRGGISAKTRGDNNNVCYSRMGEEYR